MMTGLDASSLKHLQLNAGIFLKDFDYSGCKDAASLRAAIADAAKSADHRIGATRGGGTFRCVPVTREIEADVKEEGSVARLTLRTSPREGDYARSLVWVGDTGQGFVLIDLKNALNTAGLTLTFTDRGEGTIPLEMRAHQDGVADVDEAPVTVLLIGGDA